MQSQTIIRRELPFLRLLCWVSTLPMALFGQNVVEHIGPGEENESNRLIVPYIFSTEDIGTTVGLGVFASAWPGEQANSFATAYISDQGSWLVSALGTEWRIPGTERVFLESAVMVAEWANLRVYSGWRPEYPEEIPGANDSSEDNYWRERASDVWAYLDTSYVLPIGHGKESALGRYTMSEGLIASGCMGGTALNPLKSGRTRLHAKLEYREQAFKDADELESLSGEEEPTTATLNYRLTLEHDNRDFSTNPEKGTHLEFHATHDPGITGLADDEWVFLEADLSAYFPLPSPPQAKQSVLGLNVWTGDTPTWGESDGEVGRVAVDGTPPYFRGATLGGLHRMKSYPSGRFNSRSVIYYSAEYRVIPKWQPLPEISWLELLQMKWWQWNVLGELGRVADEYDLAELHSDMKWNAGVGLNVMFGSGLGRLNFTVGPEAAAFVAMVGQSF